MRVSASPARRRPSSRSARSGRAEADEIKTKIDLSHISKPGDALKADHQQAASSCRVRGCAAAGGRPSKPSLQSPQPRRAPVRLRSHRSPRPQPLRRPGWWCQLHACDRLLQFRSAAARSGRASRSSGSTEASAPSHRCAPPAAPPAHDAPPHRLRTPRPPAPQAPTRRLWPRACAAATAVRRQPRHRE